MSFRVQVRFLPLGIVLCTVVSVAVHVRQKISKCIYNSFIAVAAQNVLAEVAPL